MNNKFDELTKSLATSVTRRGALKKFGVCLAGMALACFGLANRTEAAYPCACKNCQTTLPTTHPVYRFCQLICHMPCARF